MASTTAERIKVKKLPIIELETLLRLWHADENQGRTNINVDEVRLNKEHRLV